MSQQLDKLDLERCPHCGIARPHLSKLSQSVTHGHSATNPRTWCCYNCASCGGVVLTAAQGQSGAGVITEMFPETRILSDAIPERARAYLSQASDSLAAPVGSIVCAASAVDAMLKSKGLKDGSLAARIDEAAKTLLITPDMAEWAHEVRLDANAQRHADEASELPTMDDANRVIEFALALAELMFVLPARIAAGREQET